ncbi:MAG: riboflavin synthase [Verrucomicrobia bacterium]|nr:MAG: riboflavin synthase [Verrucomicrobiota bacterium]
MFTGIVESCGEVLEVRELPGSWRLKVRAPEVADGVADGDSVAVNGCCLTVVGCEAGVFEFDLLAETRRVTNLKDVVSGSGVNLERSLKWDGRIGGHFVSGHIDTTGRIEVIEPRGKDVFLRIVPEGDFSALLVGKGCITVDGISLTLAEVGETGFDIWLIPHTLEVTNLGRRKTGETVNLEFDLLGKYVQRFMSLKRSEGPYSPVPETVVAEG